jgi:hypothetical protein
LKRSARVVDLLAFLNARVRADLEKRAEEGDEFDRARARQGLIALQRLSRRIERHERKGG